MRKTLVLLLLLGILSLPVAAAYGSEGIEASLEGPAAEIMKGLAPGNLEPDSFLERLWAYISSAVKSELKAVLRPVAAVAAAAVLCSLGEGLQLKNEINYVNLAACLAIAVAALGDVNSVAAMGRRALADMQDFSRVLLPVLASASAGAGAVGSAAAKYAATALFMDILTAAAGNLLLPMLGAYSAALVASAATSDGRLKAVVKLMKWLCKISLTALVSVFTFYLGFTGIAASGADAAAVKAAKALIGSFVPVVGKMVAGASDTLAAGAGLIRNTVGVFGLGAVLALCAAPFVAIGLRYLLFKAAAAVVGTVAGEKIGSLVEGIGSVYGMLLGLVGTGAVFMFISIISLIRTVV